MSKNRGEAQLPVGKVICGPPTRRRSRRSVGGFRSECGRRRYRRA